MFLAGDGEGRVSTRALAYVPSMPNSATGGLLSIAAPVAAGVAGVA